MYQVIYQSIYQELQFHLSSLVATEMSSRNFKNE